MFHQTPGDDLPVWWQLLWPLICSASPLFSKRGLIMEVRLEIIPAEISNSFPTLVYMSWSATRSHNRGRRPQARSPRSSIEIAKCAIFRTNCATLNVTNCDGSLRNFFGFRVEFQEMGDRCATQGTFKRHQRNVQPVHLKICAFRCSVLTEPPWRYLKLDV